jgi:hypothetical protein
VSLAKYLEENTQNEPDRQKQPGQQQLHVGRGKGIVKVGLFGSKTEVISKNEVPRMKKEEGKLFRRPRATSI